MEQKCYTSTWLEIHELNPGVCCICCSGELVACQNPKVQYLLCDSNKIYVVAEAAETRFVEA